MALGLNKIILSSAAANTAGSYLQPVRITSIGAGNATLMTDAKNVPAGTYWWPQQASNVTIEINQYTGTANSWTTLIANNVGGFFASDGFNVRANAVTGTQAITLWTVNGGGDVSGTFNAS
jgi:hypothetical protein